MLELAIATSFYLKFDYAKSSVEYAQLVWMPAGMRQDS